MLENRINMINKNIDKIYVFDDKITIQIKLSINTNLTVLPIHEYIICNNNNINILFKS